MLAGMERSARKDRDHKDDEDDDKDEEEDKEEEVFTLARPGKAARREAMADMCMESGE